MYYISIIYLLDNCLIQLFFSLTYDKASSPNSTIAAAKRIRQLQAIMCHCSLNEGK